MITALFSHQLSRKKNKKSLNKIDYNFFLKLEKAQKNRKSYIIYAWLFIAYVAVDYHAKSQQCNIWAQSLKIFQRGWNSCIYYA